MWYLLILKWLSKAAGLLSIVLTVLSFLFVLYINTKREESSYKTLWLIVILTFPVLGAVMYIIFGNNNTAKKLEKNITKARLHMDYELPDGEKCIGELEREDKRLAQSVKRISDATGFPMVKLDSAEYFSVGEEMFADMCKELEKAEKYIFAEYFILQNGKFLNTVVDIMAKKAAQGVDVRIMYDDLGSIATYSLADALKLGEKGIKCVPFNPFLFIKSQLNNRDHRKIMVIDGAVASCGGINISDEYINEKMRFGHWKDTGFMLRGEAVAGFTAMFLEMWNVNDEHIEDCGEYIQASKKYSVSTDGFVIPFGDTPLDEVYVGKRAYINNLNNASEYTYIMTPYLVIDDEMYECMKYAAQRGVDVKIIMPHIPDKKYAFYLARTYYKELLKAGIEIYEYTPGFVHAKMSISDGKKAIVGTVNHDYRSLYLHYECAAYMLNVPAVMDIERDFKDTLELSQKITLEDVKHFNIFTKLLGHIIRLVAPLL